MESWDRFLSVLSPRTWATGRTPRVFLLAFAVGFAYTDSAISQSLNLPSGTTGSNLYDEFTSGGIRCRNSLQTPMRFDVGTLLNDEGQGGLYGRLIIPLGSKPSRFDCSRLFDLEMRRQEMEIQLLEQQMYVLPE